MTNIPIELTKKEDMKKEQQKIAEEKRKGETSPTMAIFGKLMLERLDKNTDNNSATNSNQDIPEVNIDEDEIPF